MFINPLVAEVYQNASGNVSGLAGILHDLHGDAASYFYVSLSINDSEPNNDHNSGSCIDIVVDHQTYNIVCEIDTEFLDANVNNDHVVTEHLYHINDSGNHVFNYQHFGVPLPVWIVINGMLTI